MFSFDSVCENILQVQNKRQVSKNTLKIVVLEATDLFLLSSLYMFTVCRLLPSQKKRANKA